jgi:hypothetical protein
VVPGKDAVLYPQNDESCLKTGDSVLESITDSVIESKIFK